MTKKEQEEKFKSLIEVNGEHIKRISRYYSPDAASREDLYQEIMINIWNGMRKFRGDARWSTWIYRIAVNTAIGFAGKQIKEQKVFAKQFPDDALHNLSDNTAPQAISEASLSALETEINQLNIIEKAMITLSLEGLKYKEIAEITGLTEPNVRVKMHRIKNHLKEILTPKKP